MSLNKIRLGDYIKQVNLKNKNEEYKLESVRGISTQKKFIYTKADMTGVSLKNYKIVKPCQFAYVPDTSRRGDKISLAFNDTDEVYLVSSISLVFEVDDTVINPHYLFMFFNRAEFDRYSRFNSWGSAREPFDWDSMCDIEMDLPSLTVQKKYVDIYIALKEKQNSYECGLEDLKLICDGYIEKLRKENIQKPLGNYLNRRMEKNKDFSVKKLIGVGKEGFIAPKQTKDESNGHIC